MSSEAIGIKVADGTFYPVLEEGFRGRKRLVVTTARDGQSSVQIDFYRRSVEEGSYLGSLMLEGLPPSPKGETEIEVLVGVDREGNLRAEAREAKTGEHQSLTISRASLEEGERFTVPEADFEGSKAVEASAQRDELLTGESYPIEEQDRRRTYMVRRRSPLFFVLFLLLALGLVAAAAWFVYRAVSAPQTQVPLEPTGTTSPVLPAPAAESTPSPAAAAATAPAPAAAVQSPSLPSPSPPPEEEGVWYTVRWGDTLWDISAAYYRNPWFYPRIARHPRNAIKNPDLILAGSKLFIPRN